MQKIGCLILCIVLCCSSHAQVKKKIKRGRRNKSESQFMLEKGLMELDWEIGHETINSNLGTTVYPNCLLRYGISKSFEVNAEFNWLTASTSANGNTQHTTGMEPVMLGMSYLLKTETKKFPAIIVSAQLALPFLSSKGFSTNYAAPLLQLNLQQALGSSITAGLGGGAFWDGFVTTPTWLYNANINWTFSNNKKWMLSSEWFGFVNGGPPQHNTDLTLNYIVNKRLQFGVTAGVGLTAAAHKNYFAFNGQWGWNMLRQRRKNSIR